MSLIMRGGPGDLLLSGRGVRALDLRRADPGHLRCAQPRTLADRLIMGISLIGYSMPSFFIGLVLIFFVVIKWQFLPFPSYISPWENPFQFFQTMLLPWIVLAILYAAFYIRLTRNQVLEVLSDDYVRTARAKGLPERTVVVKHALRAGLTPIVTAAGPGPRRSAGRRHHLGEHLQPARDGCAGGQLDHRFRPAADHRDHDPDGDDHHLREPGRRPALRRG